MRHLFALLFCLVVIPSFRTSAADADGVLPTGRDGTPLNFDFEDGSLKDWKTEGRAFDQQPVRGDAVSARRKDMQSQHHGEYWVGTHEKLGDDATGMLTSVPFKVTQRWASFLLGGGSTEGNRVELVRVSDSKVFFKASGFDTENLGAVVVDLEKELDKEMFIRVVDQQIGGWGHINFDNFRFYSARPKLAHEIDPAKIARQSAPPPLDDVKFAGLSAENAAKEMTLPAGFKSTLFAGEPDVVQPIAFCLDDRGRLWVAEGMDYPRRRPEGEGRDRILVLEDTDNDGKFDKRVVFLEKQNLISGLEVGFGGVWIGAAPNLTFVPVKDWDDPKPAGEGKILLDGWDYKRDTHETLNTFTWGPDGWLYGCHGVFCPSLVGKPDAPESQRQWVDAAVWRYHPTKHQFEVFAEGTSNPWGVDFDERGQCFIEACVVPHFWHMIQGARYTRQGGEHYCIDLAETARNERHREAKSRKPVFPYTYGEIKTHGDHFHYAGTKGPHAGNGRSDAAGGGHAHAGLLVYQGDSFPAEYRGKIFMNNIHGQRINMDIPVREGSGFVGKHGADFINFNDKWSQVINLLSGPDGSVFMIDWYDKNQCHHNDVNGHDRNNGRIFKISHGTPRAPAGNLAARDDNELVLMLTHGNEWHARHAQRLLQERSATGALAPAAVQTLRDLLGLDGRRLAMKLLATSRGIDTEPVQLRLLWALHTTGSAKAGDTEKILASSREYMRAWAIQFACEDRKPSDALLTEFARLAREDSSPVVRLYLASACQRLGLDQRRPILEGLLGHPEDASDHNLPLMYWYASEAVAAQGVAKAVPLLGKAKIPLLREYISKRMTATGKQTAAN